MKNTPNEHFGDLNTINIVIVVVKRLLQTSEHIS